MGLLVFALVTAIYFYGVGFNLLFLWMVMIVLTGMYVFAGPHAVREAVERQPWLHLSCYATLVLLALSHNFFSVSYDSSFAASLIALELPLVVLVTRLENAGKTYAVAGWLIFVFATLSVYEFLWQGQRAHTPLFDPNNYVTLLYLAWIPWILQRLTLKVRARRLALSAGITLIVCIAMLATTSRFALVVMAGMALLVLMLAWRLSWDWRNAASMLVAMAVAFVVFSVFEPAGLEDAFESGSTQASESADGTRMLMWQASVSAMTEHGGINGTGLFTFSLLYPQVRSELEQVTTAQFVHNDYLQLALEGGIWLLLPLLVLIAAVIRRGWIGILREDAYSPQLGYCVAIGVACVHALVNFVFYVLPLMVMLGFAVASAFRDAQRELPALPAWSGWSIWSAVSAGLLYCCLLLANDTLTYGVFSAQDHVPFAADIRKDPERMLSFAQTSQSINGHRGIPVLGEARLREVKLQAAGAQTPAEEDLVRIHELYQRAIEVDPWNPTGFTSYYQFLDRYGYGSPEQRKGLLDEARKLDPVHLNAIALSIDHAVMTGNPQAGLMVVEDMLRWCEFLSRRRGEGFKNLLNRLHGSRLMTQAPEPLRAQLSTCRNHPGFADRDGREPTPVMRWLRGEN